MRPLPLLLAPLVVASPLLAGCGHDVPAVPRSAIAVVGDRTVARSELDALMAEAKRSYAARGRSFPAEGTTAYRSLERRAVRLLVEQAVLEQEAPKLGVEVGEAEVNARLQRLKDDLFAGSEERYQARLRAAGMTDAQVRAALEAQLLSQAVRQAVTANMGVSTQAVEQYYQSHLSSYSTPAALTVRHMLVRTKAFAAGLYARVRAGASFAALARRYSRDPRTRGRGGLLTLIAGRTAPALDRIAFSLAAGAVSRPFATRFGWELVQAVSAVRPARTSPFAAVREGIRRRLLGQARAQAFQSWLDQAKARIASRTAYADGFDPGAG